MGWKPKLVLTDQAYHPVGLCLAIPGARGGSWVFGAVDTPSIVSALTLTPSPSPKKGEGS